LIILFTVLLYNVSRWFVRYLLYLQDESEEVLKMQYFMSYASIFRYIQILQFTLKRHHEHNRLYFEQVAQLSLTNPRDTLHYDKRQNFKTVMWPYPRLFCGWYVIMCLKLI